MNINQLYGGDYLKAADLQGKPRQLTIAGVDAREFDQQDKDGNSYKKQKAILSFAKTERQLVLNVTNANMIAAIYGPDTDAWIGKVVELRSEKVPFGSNIVDAIRVYVPQANAAANFQAPAQSAAPVAAAQPAATLGLDDDIPF